jgi:MoxR-like ATPase
MESQDFKQWEEVEKNVNAAEKNIRQGQNASRIIYRETKVPKEERQEKSEKEILEKTNRPRVVQKALERETVFDAEAEIILGDQNSPEQKLVELRKENLIKALRYEQAIQMQRAHLLLEKSGILKGFNGAPSGAELEALDEISEELEKNQNLREKSLGLSPEAYFGLHLKQLKKYKKELEKGKIVETDYVKEQMEDILANLSGNKPVLIYGHLGSGKSELAMHVAKKHILENHPDINLEVERDLDKWLMKNPSKNEDEQARKRKEIFESKSSALVISGSKNISQAEFYGHQVLTVDEKSGSTISDFFTGPIYKAMEEGRVVIIDEVNAIPHEVLISLNHVLTRKVGDTINIQQDSGREIVIKEGFGIMMTGNLNQGQEKYIDRQDMDPAFLSRLHKVEYDYLPQSMNIPLSEAGAIDESFHLRIAELIDKNGNLEIPKDSIEKIWKLAQAARLLQNVFAGKEVDGAYYFKEAGGRAVEYLLKENVLSIRALENIISQWKAEGYEKELDYYIWNNFIKEGTVASDRAYLYQIMKDQFGFFQSDGWNQKPDYGNEGMINSFEIQAPKNKAEKREFFGPREVVEFAFGKAPERAKWPEVSMIDKNDVDNENILPEIIKLTEFNDDLKKELFELNNEIDEICLSEKTN